MARTRSTSKKPSAASSSRPKPLEPLVFFIDRSLGRKKVATNCAPLAWTCVFTTSCSRLYRMAANEFAIPRMEPGKQRHIQSIEEARDWERFIGEVKGGRDPSMAPNRSAHVGTQLGDVAAFLDAYCERCVKPARLRCLGSVRSQISGLNEHLGHLPLSALEDPDEINRFKAESDWAEEVAVASVLPGASARGDQLGYGADTAAIRSNSVPTASAFG